MADPSSLRWRTMAIASILLTVLLFMTGCGSSGTNPGGAGDLGSPPNSAPTESSTPAGQGDDIVGAPTPEDATPSGVRAVDGSTTSQSFQVTGADPQEAIQSYETLATSAGWATTSGPANSGSTDWTLSMAKGNSTLQVTTAPADGDRGSGEDLVELSIQVTKPGSKSHQEEPIPSAPGPGN